MANCLLALAMVFAVGWGRSYAVGWGQSGTNTRPMTNADVIDLVKSGLDTDIVMTKIRTTPAKNFDTSVEGLKALNDAKVPKEIIRFMITGKEPDSAAAVASAGATDGPAGTGEATGMPKLKDGLWEIHVVSTSSSPMMAAQRSESTMSMCLDQSYSLAEMYKKNRAQEETLGCVTHTTTPEPQKMVVTQECNKNGMQTHMKTTAVTQDEEHMHSESETSMSSRGVSYDVRSTQEMRYAGSCPPDMKPGDMRGANGAIQHMPPQK